MYNIRKCHAGPDVLEGPGRCPPDHPSRRRVRSHDPRPGGSRIRRSAAPPGRAVRRLIWSHAHTHWRSGRQVRGRRTSEGSRGEAPSGMSRAGAPETSSQPSRGRAARSSDAQHSFQVTFSAHCIVLCPGVVRVENIVSAASRASRSSSTLPPAMSQASARLRIVVAPPNLVTYSLALAHENQTYKTYQTYKTNSQPRALLTRPTSSTRSSAGQHFGVPTAGKAELTSGARATARSAWIV